MLEVIRGDQQPLRTRARPLLGSQALNENKGAKAALLQPYVRLHVAVDIQV